MPIPRSRELKPISALATFVFLLVVAASIEPLHAQAACGDGIVDSMAMESCDDGNTTPGDGCSAVCQVEPGYTCLGSPSICSCADADADTYTSALCGGGDCNDGNASIYPGATEVCDGLDNNCNMVVDEGCGGVCGNGTVEPMAMESCDDGNTTPGDGCNAACQVEPGYSCAGSPSVCSCADADADTYTSALCGGGDCNDGNASIYPGAMEVCDGLDNNCNMAVDEGCGGVCGNGTVEPMAMEGCDDGNTIPGDGCSAVCQVEPGYSCAGEPSFCFCGDADADSYTSALCGGGDCDDGNFSVHPGATEVCDGLDNDCDMAVDEACMGVCGDGFISGNESCDDGNTITGDGCSSICQFEECTADSDCDNQFQCDGVETCDPMIRLCLPGVPLDCDDGDACTIDFCDDSPTGCGHELTTDSETASGPDGICNTADDNPGLYGGNGACGGSDDGTGDGLCSAIDNCPSSHNPLQLDSDGDRQGDACDESPCSTLSAYVTTQTPDLLKVDLVSGTISVVRSGLAGATGMVVDSSETRLWVIESNIGRLLEINLLSPGQENEVAFGLDESWGLALNQSESALFVTRSALGEIGRVDLPGDAGLEIMPIASGLSGPRGLKVRPGMNKAIVAEHDSGELSEVDLGGMGTVSLIASGLSGPIGVALNPSGTIAYVTEEASGELSAVTLSGGAVALIASGLAGPTAVSLDAAGTTAYVAEQFGGISAVDLASGEVSPLPFPIQGALDLDVSTNPAIEMILPDAFLGAAGSTVSVPLSLADVTGRGILAADVTVEYNPAVLTATAVTPGVIAAGCTVTPNLSMAGRAIISIFCTSELTGAGSIADISFSVVGSPAMGSRLHIAAGMLNEEFPRTCLNDGTLMVPVQISGSIAYYRDHATSMEPSTKPVAAVTLDLLDPADTAGEEGPSTIEQATSACDGTWSFPSLMPIRDYKVTPHKANDFGGSIDPFDAALNAQQVVGLTTLTPYQRLAADATGNGTLSSFDSARIAQLAVGLIAQLPVSTAMGSDWAFVPVPQAEPNQSITQPFPPGLEKGSIVFTPISESAEDQNFLAILFGDVSGNWQPPGCGPAPLKGPAQASLQAPSAPGVGGGTLELPSLTAGPGDQIRVPIKATGVAGAVSFYLDLRFDPSVVSLVKVDPGAAVAGFNLTSNTAELGRARMALFRATPIVTSGEVAVATFQVIGKSGSSTQLQLSTYTVNEGNISVTANDGAISVSGPGASDGPPRPRKKK